MNQSESISSTNPKLMMQEVFDLQKQAFKASPYSSRKERLDMLKALKNSLIKHQDRLVKSLAADFTHRSHDDSKLADILPTVMNIKYTMKQLKGWMKPEKRHVSLMFQPASAWVEYQPLGVIGVIVPWNYPVFLALGPLTAAIAAGNRAMLKLSEFTPYANRVIKEIIKEVFDRSEVAVIEGGAEVAAEFSKIPFDHLFFTGSTQVGRLVMKEAANNLTPVTLELGGKSPAIIADDVDVHFAVERLLYGKCLNGGQTCVAPDYVLCPKTKVAALVEAIDTQFARLYPSINDNPDYTAIVSSGQYQRLTSWLEEAIAAGCELITINPGQEAIDSSKQKLPLTLIIDPPAHLKLSEQEIFGPILPIYSYQNLAEAVAFVQDRPRPLALYVMTHNKKIERHILNITNAGGVCINDAVSHVAIDDLPFGGVGPSGMGMYHGHEGFKTFSKAKSVFKKGRFNSAKMALPPYGKWIHKLIYALYLR